jgi:8-oxo-dGTP diphosphatase
MHLLFLVVAAALRDKNGRVLVQRRPKGGEQEGLWEFPGGKIESGETPENALVRELSEELSIEIDVKDLSASCFASVPHADKQLVMLLYTCLKWRGDPKPLVASEVRWVLPQDLRQLPMPPADLPLIPFLESLA